MDHGDNGPLPADRSAGATTATPGTRDDASGPADDAGSTATTRVSTNPLDVPPDQARTVLPSGEAATVLPSDDLPTVLPAGDGPAVRTPDPAPAADGIPAPAEAPAPGEPATLLPPGPDVPTPPDTPAAGNENTPGTVLDGRYRLTSVVTRRGPITLWHGDDLVLARPVAVRVVPGGSPEREDIARRLLHAAVSSGRLVHPGAASTYDATTTETAEGPVSYVVSEWVDGTSLEQLLADGPMRPERAAAVTVAAARVIAAAHARGVHHGDLHPSDIVLTSHGAVKVTDLEIGAVVAEVGGTAQPAANGDADGKDMRALGGVLYAGLTGRWPFGGGRGLPAAPQTSDGKLCTPRQVRAGVPRELDTIALAALDDSRSHRAAIGSAGELAGELDGVTGVATALVTGYGGSATPADGTALNAPYGPDRTTQLPPYQPGGYQQQYPPPAYGGQQQYPQGYAPRYAQTPPGYPPRYDRRAPRRRRWIPWVTVLAVAAVVAAIVFAVTRVAAPAGSGTPTAAPTVAATPLRVATVTAFDPPPGDGSEDDAEVGSVVDGNPATTWHTETYQPPGPFGGLKKGIGLVLDMGSPVAVRQVKITFGAGGESLEMRASDTQPGTLADTTLVGTAQQNVGAVASFGLPGGAKHRYWVLWLTSIPAAGGGFQATVNEIALSG